MLSSGATPQEASRPRRVSMPMTAVGIKEVPFVIPRLSRHLTERHRIGRIDPSLYLNFDEDELYEVTEDHIGRLWFRVRFLMKEAKLEVVVLKARNLYNKARRFCDQACSVSFAVELPPLCNRVNQTRLRKNNRNPDVNETFLFDMDQAFLKKCSLHFVAKDTLPGGQQKTLGHAVFSMRELGLSRAEAGVPVTVWRDLSPARRRLVSDFAAATLVSVGLLHLSCTYYEQLERLVITLNETKEIKDCQNKDICIRLKRHLPDGRSELKQSSMRLSNPNGSARLNESFQFRLSRDQLKDFQLGLAVASAAATAAAIGGGFNSAAEFKTVGWVNIDIVGGGGCDPDGAEMLREAVTGLAVRKAAAVSTWLIVNPGLPD